MTATERINLIGSALRGEARPRPSSRALGPRGITVALLAAMVLAGMALWSAAAGEGEAAEPVWSADMTVVEYTSVSIGAATADLFSNVGGSGDLQIRSLWSHLPDRDLRLAFQEGVPNAAGLHPAGRRPVAGVFLRIAPAPAASNGTAWDVPWQDGQVIHLRIVPTAEIDVQQTNIPASGVPTISGTARVGETLTAGHLRHLGRGWAGQRLVRLPVDPHRWRRRCRHRGCNRPRLHAHRRRPGENRQAEGDLQRRQGQQRGL